MKLLSRILAALLLLQVASEQLYALPPGQITLPAFPRHNDVVREFFRHYTYQSDENIIEFAKKKDGWYVCEYRQFPKKTLIKEERLWNKADNHYANLKLFQEGGQADFNKDYLLNGFTYDYDHCPYYGYNGWDKDVIRDYFGIANLLDDTCLEGLARGLSNYAQDYFNPQSLYEPTDMDSIRKLDDAQKFSGYFKFKKGEIACYNQLRKRNPSYQTFVGGVNDVYGNEIMDLYFELEYLNKTSEADAYFKEDLYSETVQASARNYLESCAKDAILFTYGDNDTFPLWYMQEKKEIRKDITVINLSLLNTGRYITLLKRRSRNQLHPLQTTISDEQYKDGVLDVALQGQDAKPTSAHKMLSFLARKNGDNQMKVDEMGGKYYFYPFSEIHLQDFKEISYPGLSHKNREDSLNIKLKERYLTKGDILVIDLITNNMKYHPIYFTCTSAPSSYERFSPHIYKEGICLRLVPYRGDDPQGPEVNTEVSNKLFSEKFSYPAHVGTDNYSQSCVDLIRISMCELSLAYLNDSKKESARKTLDQVLKVYPDETCPFSLNFGNAVRIAYELGNNSLGDELARKIADNYLKSQLAKKDPREKELNSNMDGQILGYLESIVRDKGNKALADKISIIREKYTPTQ